MIMKWTSEYIWNHYANILFVSYGILMVLSKEHNFDSIGRFRDMTKDPLHASLPLSS